MTGQIQALAIYARTLTASQVFAASRQMAYCDVNPELVSVEADSGSGTTCLRRRHSIRPGRSARIRSSVEGELNVSLRRDLRNRES